MRIEKLNQTTKKNIIEENEKEQIEEYKKIFWKIYSKEVRIAMRCMKNR